MDQEKKISLHPRRLARKMAKAQLDRRGATGYNKHGVSTIGKPIRRGISTFSRTWRDFAVEASKFTKPSKKKGAKK